MKNKYAEYIYSVKKTEHGYMWTIWGDDWKPMQTSLDTNEKEDWYFKTKSTAAANAIETIQEFYS